MSIKVPCQNCGKLYPMRAGYRHFCSFECFLEYNRELGESAVCPFLEAKTYMTAKGKMTKYYCRSRGLYDLISKNAAMSICKKSGYCVVREQTEEQSKQNY